MAPTTPTTNLTADLTKELALVKALLAQHGQPALTQAVLEAAAMKGGR